MRIAIHHNLPSGGAKRSLYEWIQRLRAENTIHFYRFSSTNESFLDIRPLVQQSLDYELDITPSRGRSIGKKVFIFKQLISASKKMAADINAGGYDVVFVHHCTYIQSPMLLRYLKTPSLYMCQEPFRRAYEPANYGDGGQTRTSILRGFADKFVAHHDRLNARSATGIIANSYYSREVISKAYSVPVRTNYLGVDVSIFKPLSFKKMGYVLAAGRLTPHKGQHFLIQALSKVPERLRPELMLACDQIDQSYAEFLNSEASRLKVRIRIEKVKPERMPEVYNQALLTLYAPYFEPLGLVTLESMACGVPVVGVCEAGIRETVKHGETGLLTEREPDEFASAIVSLLESPQKTERMGANGVEWVAKYWTWDLSSRKVEENLHLTINKSRG